MVGSGGNLSARVAGQSRFWVTAAGSWLDRLDETSFAEVGLDGQIIAGDGSGQEIAEPTSELALHTAIYQVRPDVAAIVHLHPQMSILLDALGERIRLITTDHAFYLRRIATTPFYPPGTTDLADAVAAATADGTNCVILAQHGCSVVADSVEMALRRAVNLEEAAQLTYQALVLTGGLTGGLRSGAIPECPLDFADRDPGTAAV